MLGDTQIVRAEKGTKLVYRQGGITYEEPVVLWRCNVHTGTSVNAILADKRGGDGTAPMDLWMYWEKYKIGERTAYRIVHPE